MPFAINKTDTNLELKNGYLKIKPYGYTPITKTDSEHPHIEEAVLKGWLEVTETEPVVSHAPILTAQEETSPFEGLSEAQLLAERASEDSKKAEAAENAKKESEEANVDTSEVKEDGSVEVTEIAQAPKARRTKTDKAAA